MNFRFNEGETQIPDGWEDRSVIALSFPAGAKKPLASFAITRDNSPGDALSLTAYVDRQMIDLAKTCPRFELIRREQIEREGLPVQQLEFVWRSPDGSMVQQRQWVLLLETGVALTLTATASKAEFCEHTSAFESIFEALKIAR